MDEQPVIDFARLATELELNHDQVVSAVELLDEGNTVPFITRYRKERTGNLDEVQLRNIENRLKALRQLSERASTILRLIDSQGSLTPELRQEIEQAESLKRLEDLYLPFRPKRKSRASAAKQRGLEPLAESIWNQDSDIVDLDAAASGLINPENELSTVADVLQGAADIIAERIGENADIREVTRKIAWQSGQLVVTAKKDAEAGGQAYRDYFDYTEAISKIPPHRVLALNRGDQANVLRVKFTWDDSQANNAVIRHFKIAGHRFREFLERCASDALGRLILPGLEREVRRELTERSEKHAVDVFAQNLRNLLLQPPVRGQRVLAIDPGFRTGCKVVVLDEVGNVLANDLIYVTGPTEKRAAASKKLAEIATEYECELIVVGNGTACRETEELISDTIAEHLPNARYLIVNEAGASIYSASTIAREEFPDFDATVRGTISIGRRVQDPLSELVKIDPQHIGVGLYQHDVNPKQLKESLEQVIESCVNYVGVDLNTASASLLRSVSGLNQLIARRVVEWRDKQGPFRNRKQLLEVSGVGEATFTQAAGFLKIIDGDDPLDSTWIHPESYEPSRKVLERLSMSPEDLVGGREQTDKLKEDLAGLEPNNLADELQVGLPTLDDIIEAIARPGRDPRTDLPGPLFRQGILKLDDLEKEMELTGTVLNVVDFGAFIDIGLKDSGLVHISQLSNTFVRSPHDVVSVGDVVTAWVLDVDTDRRRVSLTMVKPGTPAPKKQKKPVKVESKVVSPDEATSSKAKPKGQFKPTRKKPQKKTGVKKKPPAPKLKQEVIEGREPMRGFDELKQLWKKKDG